MCLGARDHPRPALLFPAYQLSRSNTRPIVPAFARGQATVGLHGAQRWRSQERNSRPRGGGGRRTGPQIELNASLLRSRRATSFPDTEVTTSLTRLFPIMPESAPTRALVAMAQSIYGELCKTLKLEGSGGAADSSYSAGVF
jgi:hypothetical protein